MCVSWGWKGVLTSCWRNAKMTPPSAVRNLPETISAFKILLMTVTMAGTPARFLLPGTVIQRCLALAAIALLLAGCDGAPWNNPYSADQVRRNLYFGTFSERPKHLDPARSYSSNEWAFISQVYEPPLQYHFLQRPYQLEPQVAESMPEIRRYGHDGALLAEDVDPSQIAFTDYHVRIRPGVKYQPHPAFARSRDGAYRYWPMSLEALERVHELRDFEHSDSRELTAGDFVYQIKRLAFPGNHSPIAGLMAEYIVGFRELTAEYRTLQAERKAAGEAEQWLDLRPFDMAGVEVTGRYRYRVRVQGSYPQFIYWLAMNFFAPMPWEAERFYQQPRMKEKNISLDWYPVGTGPFMLSENNPNLRMVLERNPNFRGEAYPIVGMADDRQSGLLDDAGRIMPFVDRAVYSLEKEAIPRWNKFLQGYYDNSGIASDAFDQAVQFASVGEPRLTEPMQRQGIEMNTAVDTSIYYTGFNMKDPLVGGDSERARLLRRAISIALDMEEYISIFQNGRGEAAHGPLPPGIFGYLEGEAGINPFVYQWADGRPQRRAIEQARALLAQAGYPGGRTPEGKPLILYYDTANAGPDARALLDWYRKQFEKLGIELVIRATDYNRFQDKMLSGKAQIYSWGWNADYPDPENFFFLLYGPNGKVDFKGENASNYWNPEFDALFDRMKNLPNGEVRQAIIDQMVEILRRDAPWLWGFYPKSFGLHHAWYKNAKPHLMANNTLKYKRIDAELRAQKQAQWNRPKLWPIGLLLLLLLSVVVPAFVGFRRRERSAAR